ncbi:serine/threonine-protein kinase Nek11 isoform X2 [Phodopus roborovskii]|uniref:serine/threonine-protein kinase Nek11 isoform X2 n=1 Tax=Phodopus roborovskii TaxID=109678 RepID=UPI0021E42297|nr:serine/threonine-protein kinase Nek11 isoform X2 [Phodopus roborovskii]
MLKFQETTKCVSGTTAISKYPTTLIARRYVLQQKLGSGSFGTVYLVSDKKAKQGEELKVLKEISVGELNPNETVQANVEAQLLSKLNHPAIVKFHASFMEQDNFCIITEYCEGGDLDYKIQEYKEAGKIFPENQIVEWFIQLLLGVDYMHERSLACILYEMCCMDHAFAGSSFLSVVLNIVEGNTPSLPEGFPQELNTIMQRMLNKSPSLRPSAVEILKLPYIDEQLQHLMRKYSEVMLEDKNSVCQKDAVQIINAMQKKIHLQTLQALSEVQKMTPRERMRLRKLQAADEKARKLKKIVEEKYKENNKRVQESQFQNFDPLSVDMLHELDERTSENPPEPQPLPSLNRHEAEPSLEDTIVGLGHYGIPEDPLVAEEYYADVFDSCSEESEELEEETVFSEAEEQMRDKGAAPAYRANQQDSDIEALVGCLENVLGCTSLDTRTITSTAADTSPRPSVFNSEVARTKMQHMKESAMQKLGMEVFEEVYDYLRRARHQKACEAEVREHLETVVPRASDCFEVDQLLYLEEQLLTTEGKEPALRSLHCDAAHKDAHTFL